MDPAQNTRLYQDTLELIRLYNTNLRFKSTFARIFNRPKVTYKGRPLRLYIYLISKADRNRYQHYLKSPLIPETVGQLLEEIYTDDLGLKKLEQSVFDPTQLIPLEEHRNLAELDSEPINNRVNLFEKFLSKKGSGRDIEIEKEEEREEVPSGMTPDFIEELEEPLKDIRSKGQITIRRGGAKMIRGATSVARDVAGDLFRGGGRLAGGAGKLALQGAARGLVALGGATAGTVGAPIIIAILIVVAVIILGPILMNLLQTSALCPPNQPSCTAVAGATTLTLPTTDISSCQFTRGDHNPKAASFVSPKLLSYFQEAEKLTSVPAVVLASIARVESPSIVSKTDEQAEYVGGVAGCPRSPTGALGIMQIQPPETRGHFAPGVELGASFLGKTVTSLTESDYCDLRSSIILSAGFILKKLELGYKFSYKNEGESQIKWNPVWVNDRNIIYRVAESYYGCLSYGGGNPLTCSGPYNYGDDIWTSIQSCQRYTPSGTGLLSCPINSPRITAGSVNTPGGHCTPSYQLESRCSNPDLTGRSTAIDVQSSLGDRAVYLPLIGGQNVTWTVESTTQVFDFGGYVGDDLVASTSYNGTSYRIRFVHLESPAIHRGDQKISGAFIANYRANQNHVHLTLQENGKFMPVDLYFKLCQ